MISYDDDLVPSLSLRIDFVSFIIVTGLQPTLLTLLLRTQTAITNPLPPGHNQQSDARQGAHELLMDWLKAKASERPGYDNFVKRRHTTMQNCAVVETWAFAAEFSLMYFKQRHQFDTRVSVRRYFFFSSVTQ